ncbi:MAG TPA: putative metal-binding motif-containing protein [Solirubrobacterales bacterium]|nr:putative metal-binding motif-containing protein [Solirubrobacterales bacterium]
MKYRLGTGRGIRTTVTLIATAVLASLLVADLAPAAPINDDFADRLPIQFGSADTRSNVDATVEPDEQLTANDPSGFGCDKQGGAAAGGFQMGGTLWWEFTGTGGPLTVSTLSSNFDTVMGLYEMSGGELLACNDDIQSQDPTRPTLQFRLASEVLFDSVAGAQYAVQVGGCIPAEKCGEATSGNVTLRVSPPPANDSRAAAMPIAAGTPLAVSNTGATTEPGETTTCDGHLYGKTAWFRYTAPAIGTAAFSAAGFDTLLAVYRGGSTIPLGCNDDAVKGQFGASRLPSLLPPGAPLEVSPGDYLIQVGGFYDNGFSAVAARNGPLSVQVDFVPDQDLDNDGVNAGRDCDEGNAAIRPGATEVPNNGVDEDCDGFMAFDRDGDGVLAPPLGTDCDDGNRKLSPLTEEIRGNRIDENCDTKTPDFRALPTKIGLVVRQYVNADPHSWIRAFSLSNVPDGVRVEIRCSGANCPYLTRSYRVKQGRGTLELAAGFRLEVGDLLDVRVTKPEAIGREQTFRIRRDRKPAFRTFCLDPTGHRRPC